MARSTESGTPPLPLSTLLARVLGALSEQAESAVGPGQPSLARWANLLRCVPIDGIPEGDLPRATRMSARLTTTAITRAAQDGWVTTRPVAGGGKGRLVLPALATRMAADVWPATLSRLDEAWAGTSLRDRLESIVSGLPFELPHHPACYGAADPSAVGGPFMQNAARKPGRPAHGSAWRPVPRHGQDTTSALPITALLSQAVMGFTIDYEDVFPWPLANTARFLSHLGSSPTPLTDLPPGHGVTGMGKSLLERHLLVELTPEGAVLTDRGRLVVERHPGRLATTEKIWRERHGGDAVDGLRDALQASAGTAAPVPGPILWDGRS